MYAVISNIYYNEENQYWVDFKTVSDMDQIVFVRLFYHYYAKILYNFDPNDELISSHAKILFNNMGAALNNNTLSVDNILKIVDIDDVVTIETEIPKNSKVINLSFGIKNNMGAIITDIPTDIYCNQLVFSVFILLSFIIKNITSDTKDKLITGLRYMNKQYASNGYSDLNACFKTPNEAYLST